MRTAASCRRLWTLPIVYLMMYVLERVSGRSDTNEDDVSSTEIHLTTPRGRERAVLLVGQMSGQLIAFDAWTGEIINSINSGGALVSNCRTDIMQDLHSDGSLSALLQPSARQKNNVATSISLQTPEKAFDQHNFAPTMDGRLYHLSEHDGEWKEVFLSTSRLLQSKKPLRAKDNPELSNVVFVAEKQQRLFTFDADTGQMYPFFSADATAAATAFSNTVSTEQPSTVLMGRVDVTTKMVNLHDVLDFKCVTVSEYFVQFAATAQCDVEKTPESTGTPWIEMEMSAESNVVSLAGYDPDSRRILWKWNSHVDLTMVYGVLPKQGIKFFQWDVALPVGVDDAESATQSLDRDDDDVVDSSCPTPPPLAPSKSSSVQATASSAVATIHRSPRPNLLYRHIDGQPYLLPSPKDLSPADSTFLDNGTTKNNAMSGHSIVVKRHQQQRPWNFKTVEIDGEKGVVLTSKHVVSIVLAVAVVVMVVAYVFYRKGLIAKPDSPSPQDRDVPPLVSTPSPSPPSTPVMSPRAEPEASPGNASSPRSPKSPLLRNKTGLEHLMRMVTPAKMHRSLSFGGFSHAPPPHRPNVHNHNGGSTHSPTEWLMSPKPPVRLSDISAGDISGDSAQSGLDGFQLPSPVPTNAPTAPTTSLSSLPTTTTEEFSKILPYICRGRFANEFEELSTLGKGGFGQVMLAENRLDGRKYAVKRVGLSLRNQTKTTLEKFLREVKILARLDHTYIVRYYQAWLEELGEDEVVPAMSDAGGSYVTTANYTRRDGAGTSSEYSARNMLQRHSFDEKKFANDDEDMSTDSLYAPRRFSGQRDNDGDDEDSGGFVWDREGGDNASMEQWSEQDLYKDDSTVSVRRSATRNTTMQRYSRRPRGEKATTATSVVPLIDHWLYIQMQYCSEQCLADVLLAPGRRNYSHMLEMFFQIASALEHVHSLGLIHRDLKPQNIFVMDSDTIKLGDFGLSRYAGGGNSSSDGMDPPTVPLAKQDSSTWSMDDEKTVGVGTYLYASPEQISGETYNAKADMYSLGMILFEMMHEPFGTTMERVVTLRNLREGNLPPCWLQDHPPVVSMVTSLVTTCPSDRPSAFDVVTWCQTQLHLKSSAKNGSTSNNNHHKTHDDNVHVLQVEAVEWDNSTVCHNLLLALCDVIRAMPSVVIVACGLKQHMSYGQVLEFTLHVDTNQVLAQVQDAIAAAEGVKHVELLS
ncbi:PEK protein kinase [Aphanomyces invadans]|uniref:non-specific serine/threonine protein kinase n=1 Tax=Aphanomyces invadans TaxID=157072 RepID=A0A024TW82_9STRA|nr:PEK protein kinase [Aphanomyces invadans]ETV98254.1 PEK protein kinase [Aphanomyces invadans]|eukprot:XP_008873129.1 PEK protein kinase [Aphanomyces invadans]